MPGVRSQNGWTANDRSVIATRTVRGTRVRLAVRTGPAGDLLLEIAALFDLMVQDIDTAAGAPPDDWGYAERAVRGSDDVSNHASGTAVDLNATRWPLGSRPEVNLSASQIATVRALVAATKAPGMKRAAVRWGGDYTSRKDPMHFEIADGITEADCARALAALRSAFGRPLDHEGDDELDATEKTQLAEIHREITQWLANRRGPNGEEIQGGGADTVLGYAANADGFGYRAAMELAFLHQKVDWLHDNLPAVVAQATTPAGGLPALDYDQLAAALLRQMANRSG